MFAGIWEEPPHEKTCVSAPCPAFRLVAGRTRYLHIPRVPRSCPGHHYRDAERQDSNPKALRLHGSRFFRRTRVTLQPRVADIVAIALRKKRRKGLEVVS
jgi:hypothetical protein